MAMARFKLSPDGTLSRSLPGGGFAAVEPRVDRERLDATDEADIARHKAQDDDEAALETARYVQGLRVRLNLSQASFAKKLGVPVGTIQNWEQGKREPQGPARALLRLIDRMPEAAMDILGRD